MAGSETASTVTGDVTPPGGGESTREDAETEEFDPIGTLALIMTYFAILVIAWIYVYFIEFLSRDLTVIG